MEDIKNGMRLINLKNAGLGLGLISLGAFVYAMFFPVSLPFFSIYSMLFLLCIGGFLYTYGLYGNSGEGIKNNGVRFSALTHRGWSGWLLGIVLTLFYIILYFYPRYLGFHEDGNTGLVAFFDPLSKLLNGYPATQWFVYGTLYTLAIFVFGVKFMVKYRHNRYQVIRTLSVIFFQLIFAYFIPELLAKLNPDTPYFAKDLKNMWPLNHYFFESWHLKNMLNGGLLGKVMLGSGLLLIFFISPYLTYRFGKRWYCSWVCGCGALAETAGDPFRQLSSKKLSVWKLERWSIHLVLVFVFLTTIALLWSFFGSASGKIYLSQSTFATGCVEFLSGLLGSIFFFKRKELDTDARYTMVSIGLLIVGTICIQSFASEKHLLFISSYQLSKAYGFAIGAIFSGVLGVGFYPLLGSRVWCRFGCPMAAILGLQQRLLSRFRITTNGGQCISCGNCSAYCEMGIDVRAYAQRGENIVRSSCVGCGICSAVCPRGVLKLENVDVSQRLKQRDVPFGNQL